MTRTLAMKEAQKRYMAKIKGTAQGDKIYEKLKELNKRAFNKKYHDDETFRKNKNEYCKWRQYYKDYENGTLKAVKFLFGENIFYGR
jgi:hypothetical protein